MSALTSSILGAIVYWGAQGAFGDDDRRRNESSRHVKDSSGFRAMWVRPPILAAGDDGRRLKTWRPIVEPKLYRSGAGLLRFSVSSGSWPHVSFPKRPPWARLYVPAFSPMPPGMW